MHGIIVLNRNGPRRPFINGRRRKKISPFKTRSRKTMVLWAIFVVFVASSSALFFLLLYLDLVLREKNSKELALCCGAFSVSLLTALRIWVSLPDENDEERPFELRRRATEPVTSRLLSAAAAPPDRLPSNQTDLITVNNEFLVRDILELKRDTSQNSLPPAYSSLNLDLSYLEPPNYEDAIKKM